MQAGRDADRQAVMKKGNDEVREGCRQAGLKEFMDAGRQAVMKEGNDEARHGCRQAGN